MPKVNLQDIGSGYNLQTVVNNNNQFLEDALDNTISRDGSAPNYMAANLDMNSYKVINLGSPESLSDAARLADIVDLNLLDTAVPSQTGNSGKYLTTNGTNLSWAFTNTRYPISAAETAAGIVSGDVDDEIPWGWITRYGAVGDDSTLNTAAIQMALDQCSAGGDWVVVPKGTFCTGGLSLESGAKIIGFGRDSCIKLANAGNDHLLANTNGNNYVDDIIITGVLLDGNKANNTTNGAILYLNGRRNSVYDCDIENSLLAGLLIGAPSLGTTNTPLAGGHTFAKLRFKNCGKSNGWGSIGVMHGNDINFSDIIAICDDGGTAYHFDIEPESGNSTKRINLTNFTFTGGRLLIDGKNLGGSGTVDYVNFSNGTVDATGSYRPSDLAIMAPLFLAQCRYINGTNVHLIGEPNSTWGGIHAEEGGTTTTWNVEYLNLKNVTVQSSYAGVRPGRFSVCRYVTIDGGSIDVNTTTQAMEFPGCDTVRVSKLRVANASAAGLTVNIGSSAVNVQFDETCTYSTGHPTIIDGVQVNSTAYGNNCEVRRIKSGSATFDAANMVTATEQETTVTVTGVALGDFVDSVGISIDVADLLMVAQVTGTDTVSVSLMNATGGDVNIPSGTLRVRCLKVT